MAGDKRNVSTDALETLGTILDENQQRDAIHLAVEPVVAGEMLYAGSHVGIALNGKAYTGAPLIGIVDPFLPAGGVMPGQRFWLVIYPRMVTSLRHVWTHPALDGEKPIPQDEKEYSEAWLRDFLIVSSGPSYETLLESVSHHDGDDYLLIHGEDASGEIPPKFWDHIEIVTGKKFPMSDRADHFACSC